ncbi:3-hydroxyacyl-CoA dehydrogenase NAD-binding domain-containing protein [Martelella mediterranea]|uniref:Fatty acid oxidation complex subunit alpha n=1 Tax=Martelella mediterranea DSM 17316 TaxID=1122214 RepID=A0A1U9Z5N4_9HYPH|nr:3-hydroxyacyl-CoA dehydrogenase NAD-binding domain-containing protein [Martelella mediterranea]AQZ53027.1 Fatty acid oxidation complex subunit alpha [Martelella mediterranea DSM 17316]
MTMTMPEERLVRIERLGEIAVLTIDRPPANALSQSLRQALVDALKSVKEDAHIAGAVIACAGRTFIAGAEISELGQPLEPGLPEVLSLIENLGKPTAAALHGTALGGGFEVALACTFRIAGADAKIGLPEVTLGILPGSGGTVRTTWLAGAETALRLAGSGAMMPAADALAAGLIDLVADGDPVAAAVQLLRSRIAANDIPAALSHRSRPIAVDPDRLGSIADGQRKTLKSRAPERVLDSVLFAQSQSFEAALAHERALFLEAVASPASAALRHLFFAERAAARGVEDKSVSARQVECVGVIGSGTMGRGIAMAFANAGFQVLIFDASPEALEAGLASIAGSYERMVERGMIDAAAAEARVGLIKPQPALARFEVCDLIVEAVFEDMQVKQAIFTELDAIAKPGAILATNTSYLDVNIIAGATSRPADVVGLHFFSPAHIMKLLEIVRARDTAADVLKTANAVARRLGKQAVTVGVCRGFVGNRMLQARNRAVPDLLCEGAAPADIDRAFRAFGWPMGPCEMQDLAGLDISWRMRKAEGISEPIADAICESGRIGRKAGKGWYDYPDGRASPSDEVDAIIAEVARARGVSRRRIGDAEIIARTHDAMVAEGQALLAEGIARSASDIDVVWVNGYGFPRELGGPMYWNTHLRNGAEN